MKRKLIPTQSTIPTFSQTSAEAGNLKRVPFSRKRHIDVHHNQGSQGELLSQQVKENPVLQKQASFDELKHKLLQSGGHMEIKYMSPHFIRNNHFTSPPQKKDIDSKQKFSRRPGTFKEGSREGQTNKNQPETPPYRKYVGFDAEISLDSALTKGSDVTEFDQTPPNWFTLEADNQCLKQEKIKLQQEVLLLKALLKKANIPIPRKLKHTQRNNDNRQISLTVELERKLDKATKEFEKREGELKSMLKLEQMQIELMREEFRELNQKYETELQSKNMLLEVIETLRKDCSRDRRFLEAIYVKQGILLKRKQEFEYGRQIAAKADKQRKSLQKTLGQYKKKMIKLNKIVVKDIKRPKRQIDQSLELSLDLSTTFDD